MALILQEPCKTCQGCGFVLSLAWKEWYAANPMATNFTTAPTEPEELRCVSCEGSRKVLTEDGKAVATLINSITTTQNHYRDSAAMRREEAASRRQWSLQDEMDNLRRTIEQERRDREDLEKKLKTRR